MRATYQTPLNNKFLSRDGKKFFHVAVDTKVVISAFSCIVEDDWEVAQLTF